MKDNWQKISHPLKWIILLCLVITMGTSVFAQEEPADESAEPVAEEAAAPPATEEVLEGAEVVEEEGGKTLPGQSIWEKLEKGGITIFFLLLLSIAGLTFTLERVMNLKRDNILPDGLIEDVEKAWRAGDFTKAEHFCEQKPSTAGRILEAFVHYREYPASELHPIASDIAGRDLKRHLQKAYPLAVVGAVAPLLGLMGTVFGMIESFEVVAVAGSLGDASILADGISKALVTTAAGLVIAIPFLLLYHYFKTRTTLFAIDLEEQINEFLKRVMLKKRAATAEGETVKA